MAPEADTTTGRPQRSTRLNGSARNGHIEDYNSVDAMEEDDEPDAASSGQEWDSGDGHSADEDEAMSDMGSLDEDDAVRPSLVVQLRYGKGNETQQPVMDTSAAGSTKDTAAEAKPPPTGPIAAPNGSAMAGTNHHSSAAVLPTKGMESSGLTPAVKLVQPPVVEGQNLHTGQNGTSQSSV